MALPSAVKRNAEKARNQVAAESGAKAPVVAPQQGGGEYLSVNAAPPVAQAASIAPVPPDALAAQQLESMQPVQQQQAPSPTTTLPVDNYIPHALAGGNGGGNGLQHATPGALSAATDTAIPGVPGQANTDQIPDFIDLEDWKGRYAALRVSRDERIAGLEQEVNELRATNDSLTTRLAESGGKESAANRFELDHEARATLGEDQAKVFDHFNQQIEDRFAEQDAQQQVKEQQTHSRFISNLESMVPRWRDMNKDERFLNWLSGVDETIGMSRQAMLDRFVSDHDAESAAAIFRSFAVNGAHVQQGDGHTP
ncbi:MAG: hypothetical protein KAG66_10870, partial [Methylococcales bacterium]|nr:hypothetical protein [Methylococcales bacterium]